MTKLKYCCEEFKSMNLDLKNECHPNIRIIKFTNPLFHMLIGGETPKIKKRTKSDFSFGLMEGYEIFDPIKTVYTRIDYCPFCGMDLHKFYKGNDSYANEIEGITFDCKSDKNITSNELRKIADPLIYEILLNFGFLLNEEGEYFKKIDDKCIISIILCRNCKKNHYIIMPLLKIEHLKVRRLFTCIIPNKVIDNDHFANTTHIGYVMPQDRYIEWDFHTGCDFKYIAEDFKNALSEYGILYLLRQVDDFPFFLKQYEEGNKHLSYYHYILPLMYYINGDFDKMKKYLDCEKDHSKENDSEWLNYNIYSEKLLDFVNKVDK